MKNLIICKEKANLLFITSILFFFILLLWISIWLNLPFNHKVFGQILLSVVLIVFIILYRINLFLPHVFVPFITLLYGFFGGINFIKRGAYVDMYNELHFMQFSFSIMLVYTILSFTTVSTFSNLNVKSLLKKDASQFLINLIIFLGFMSVVLDWFQIGGIPLFNSLDSRMNSMPFFRLFFIISIFFSYYKVLLRNSRRNSLILGVFILCAILSAYRTPLFFILIILFFKTTQTEYFKKNILKILIAFLLIFFSLNLLKLYRDVNKYGIDHYYYIMNKEELPRQYILISPIIHTVREGPQIFQQIRNNINGDYGKGKYLLEHFSTILPGKQRNYGQIYNNITRAETDNTKTGTILSPFYIDFGVLGIFVLGMVLGIINFGLKLKSVLSPYRYLIYMFFISFEITWIHGGAPFSPTFILVFGFLIILLPFFNSLTSEKYLSI